MRKRRCKHTKDARDVAVSTVTGVVPNPTGNRNTTHPASIQAMALSYSWLTFAQARTELAARLSDPNKTFWVDAELGIYIVEALRTWNSLAQFYKDRDSFSTAANTQWYDLTSVLALGLRSYNVTDLQLLTEIEYQLIEPPTGATWTGSEMFTVQDILTALQRRRDQFLNETGTVITRSTQGVSAPTEGRVSLGQGIMTFAGKLGSIPHPDSIRPCGEKTCGP